MKLKSFLLYFHNCLVEPLFLTVLKKILGGSAPRTARGWLSVLENTVIKHAAQARIFTIV